MNLLVHFPETAERVLKDDFLLLISDSIVVKIFNKLAERYRLDQKLVPEKALESMPEGEEREIFNEVMLSVPMYKKENIKQAIAESEKRIQRILIQKSILDAKDSGNIEKINEVYKLKN